MLQGVWNRTSEAQALLCSSMVLGQLGKGIDRRDKVHWSSIPRERTCVRMSGREQWQGFRRRLAVCSLPRVESVGPCGQTGPVARVSRCRAERPAPLIGEIARGPEYKPGRG